MSDHEGPRLAIVIPSFRFDTLAKETLSQAATIGSSDIRVHIADNSENPRKHAFLEALAAKSTNVVVTCHETNIGAEANWSFLINAQTAPYVCIAADDDCFGAAFFRAGLDLVLEDPHCSAGSGLLFSVAHSAKRGKPPISTPVERTEVDPLARIRNYHGSNALAYGISKRSIIQDYADYMAANPLKCPFNDYVLAFHLLSMGTYRINPTGYVYVYNNSNWQMNDDFIRSNGRHYKAYGLPESFGYLTRLHWGVVVAHFFSSRFRSPELTDERASAIVSYLFNRQRTEFTRDFYRYKRTFDRLFADHPAAAAACRRLLSRTYDHVAPIFDEFERVVAVFSPDVARRYRVFQAETTWPQSEAITPAAAVPFRSLVRAEANVGNILRRAFGWFP